jgi:hypothetical protein
VEPFFYDELLSEKWWVAMKRISFRLKKEEILGRDGGVPEENK